MRDFRNAEPGTYCNRLDLYNCKYCNLKFRSKMSLRDHERKCQENEHKKDMDY